MPGIEPGAAKGQAEVEPQSTAEGCVPVRGVPVRAWLLLGLSLALLASLGAWQAVSLRAEARRDAERDLTAVADSKVAQVAAWRAERLGDAGVIADGGTFSHTACEWLAERDEARETLLRRTLMSSMRRYGYRGAALTDAQGTVLLAVGSGDATLHAEAMEAVRAAIGEREPVLTDLHAGPGDLGPHLDVVAPIPGDAPPHAPVGAIVLHCLADDFLYPLLREWPTSSPSGESLLVRQDGDEVLFLNEVRHQAGTALRLRLPASAPKLPAALAARGHEGIVEGNDYRGIAVLAATRSIPGTPWKLVAKEDRSEALAVGARSGLLAVMLALAALAVTTAGAFALWQRGMKIQYIALFQAQREVARAAERMAVTIRSIGDAVIATDREGRIEFANEVAERLTGWTEAEARGKPASEVFRVVNEETRAPVPSPVQAVLERGLVVGLANHTLLISRDGRETPIADSGAPIRGPGGELGGVVLVFRDQTPERRRAMALEARVRLAHAAAELSVDELMQVALGEARSLTESDGAFLTLLDCSAGEPKLEASWQRGTGVPEPSLAGDGLWATCVRTMRSASANDARPRELVCPVVREGRVRALVALCGATDDYDSFDEEAVGLLAELAIDIAGHKRAEAEIHKLGQAVDQSPLGVMILTREGIVEYANPRFAEITGHDREEIVGRHASLMQSEETPPEMYVALDRAGRDGVPWAGLVRSRRSDGSAFWDDVRVASIRDAAGEVTHIVTMTEDVTERVSLEEQLAQSQRMDVIGRLAGGVAHDFNNMLHAVLGHTELCLEDATPGTSLHTSLGLVRDAAERSAALTRQLLAFARRQVTEPIALDMNRVVSGMLPMLRRLIGEDIDLSWKPAADLGICVLDPSQVDQLLANLLVNSRDAIGGVGHITIETANAEFDEAYCRQHLGYAPGSYVMLAVSDDGCGMDAETLAHVFEPFYTTKGPGSGTGLGLATVYGVVRQNDGFVNVYSEPGDGTTFRIYFPRKELAAQAVTTLASTGFPLGDSERVLLVEDDDMVRGLTEEMLSRLGYRVVPASGPEDAIGLLEGSPTPVDLLITDVVMPTMNGRQLADRLGTIQPGIRCLFMSGYTANVIAHRGVLDEGVTFVQKPFTLADLAHKVREALGDG